jgi:hypothetical protein
VAARESENHRAALFLSQKRDTEDTERAEKEREVMRGAPFVSKNVEEKNCVQASNRLVGTMDVSNHRRRLFPGRKRNGAANLPCMWRCAEVFIGSATTGRL